MLSSVTPPSASDSHHGVASNKVTIKRELGKGHNAVVYLVQWNTDPTPRAMKEIPRNNKRTENMNRLRANNPARSNPNTGRPLPRTATPTALVDRRGTEEAKIRKEIAIMQMCDHPNIIKFFSFIDDQMSANICLIMEYMEGGELQWQVENGVPYLTLDQTRRFTRDIVLGLQYLHLQGIIHRDIKPSNIMWTADRMHVKIGDFGVAHLVDELGADAPESSPRHAGTPAFLAPEIAPGGSSPMPSNAVSPAIDLWALGGAVAVEASVYRAIREEAWTLPGGRGKGTWSAPSCGSECMCSDRMVVEKADWGGDGVLGLLGGLLIKDPRERWRIENVKNVAWLLHDVLHSSQGTTPEIVVSAADEAHEPKCKWNLKWRFSNLFRVREREEGTGAVRSDPNVKLRPPKRSKEEKGKGRRKRDSDKTLTVEKENTTTKKSRSVDASSLRLKGSSLEQPRRGSKSVTALPRPPRTRRFFSWGGGKELPSLHPLSSTASSSITAQFAVGGAVPATIYAADYEKGGDDRSVGSSSGCSYGSGARTREGWRDGDEDDDDPDAGYDDWNPDGEEDDEPRVDVYNSTSSGDEENVPITVKARTKRTAEW
ncbi:kinase-like domain-containing protein [Mycena leptocephala]|nr:kinase-like domain-containing protein [Mycena leptocephala]